MHPCKLIICTKFSWEWIHETFWIVDWLLLTKFSRIDLHENWINWCGGYGWVSTYLYGCHVVLEIAISELKTASLHICTSAIQCMYVILWTLVFPILNENYLWTKMICLSSIDSLVASTFIREIMKRVLISFIKILNTIIRAALMYRVSKQILWFTSYWFEE